MDDFDYAVFHAPYNKLVQYSFGRYLFNDFRRNPDRYSGLGLEQFASLSPEETYVNKDLLKAIRGHSKDQYDVKVAPSELVPSAFM